MLSGPYMRAGACDGRPVAATNKTPVSSVRGAGYPQAAFAMERLMDRVARELRLDRAEVRRRNLIPAEKMPYTKPLKARSGAGMQYDSGDYPACQAEVLRRPAGTTFPRRQAAARDAAAISASAWRTASKAPAAGRSNPAWCGCRRPDASRSSPAPPRSGRASRTALAQDLRRASSACARRTSPSSRATPAASSLGLGAFASRQTVTAGSSVLLAARAVAEKAKKLASHVLEAAEHDLEIADGEVRVVGAPELSRQARRARAHPARARPATASRRTSTPASTPTSIGAPTRSPMPTPAMSPRSRSISRPAGCSICATWRCRTPER